MSSSRFEKFHRLQKDKGLDTVILTSPSNLKCFSGYHFYFEPGPSPFHVLPASLIVPANKTPVLLIVSDELNNTDSVFPGIAIKQYRGYAYDQPLFFTEDFSTQCLHILQGNDQAPAVIGIEENFFPYSLTRRSAPG